MLILYAIMLLCYSLLPSFASRGVPSRASPNQRFAGRGDPFCVPPACGERRPLGPACGRGQLGGALFSCGIFRRCWWGWDAYLWDFSAVLNLCAAKCLVKWSVMPSVTTSSGVLCNCTVAVGTWSLWPWAAGAPIVLPVIAGEKLPI